MHGTSGRVILACCILCAVVGCLAFLLFRTDTEAQSEEPAPAVSILPEIGKFRVGAELGRQRAGFCGNPMLQIFTHAGDPNFAAVQACLLSAAVTDELDLFTPILVDEDVDTDCEKRIRDRDGLGVVVRGLNGKFLGGLPHGFACQDLTDLLQSIRRHMIRKPEKSPVYARLLDAPAETIDWLKQKGSHDKAARCVEFLGEFEGAAHPATTAAAARLGL